MRDAERNLRHPDSMTLFTLMKAMDLQIRKLMEDGGVMGSRIGGGRRPM
jgi:hypothetical protein